MKSHPQTQPRHPIPRLPDAPGLCRLRAAGIASPVSAAIPPTPADLLVRLGPAGQPGRDAARSSTIIAVGTPAEIDTHPDASAAAQVDLTNAVLMPGMVNAHTHLDLTHLGPIAHDPSAGFVAWVDRVRDGRAQSPDDIAASVRLGIDLSLRAGVVLVGDIAGAAAGVPRTEPLHALGESPLSGVSFLEFFAIGVREPAALKRLDGTLAQIARDDPSGRHVTPLVTATTRLGLQPHATNTVSPRAYQRTVDLAKRHNLPLATHLAETPEEHEFIARGTGPQRDMLERFGIWSDDILADIGKGNSPVEHLAPALRDAVAHATGIVAAHVNDLTPDPARAIAILKETGTHVAYCPSASAYFDAPAHFGPHGYREMLRAGVNVCLGTDSILNLPPGSDAPEGPGISIIEEARALYARDAADPETLLRMMTVNGCAALGWNESACSLAPGTSPLGLVAVDVADTPADIPPAERILRSRARPTLLTIAPK